MDLMKSIAVSTSGMNAQTNRMQAISENIANAESLVTENGGPYRRKLITFESVDVLVLVGGPVELEGISIVRVLPREEEQPGVSRRVVKIHLV